MSTIKVHNHRYGNYSESIVPNIRNSNQLNDMFFKSLQEFKGVNVSYDDGLMLTMTLNIKDDYIGRVNYLTINRGAFRKPGSAPEWEIFGVYEELKDDEFDEKGKMRAQTNIPNFSDIELVHLYLNGLTVGSNWSDGDYVKISVAGHAGTGLYYAVVSFKEHWYSQILPYFVLSYQYIKKNQYAVTCKLDTVLATLKEIKKSEAIVERGFVTEENKLIYNNEGIEVTAIKTEERVIGETVAKENILNADVGYYAVYMDHKIGSTNDEADKLVIETSAHEYPADATYMTMADVPFKDYIDNTTYIAEVLNLTVVMRRAQLVGGDTYLGAFYDILEGHVAKYIPKSGGGAVLSEVYGAQPRILTYNTKAEWGPVGNYYTFDYTNASFSVFESSWELSYRARRALGGVGALVQDETSLYDSALTNVVGSVLDQIHKKQVYAGATPAVPLDTSSLLAWDGKIVEIDSIKYRVKIDKKTTQVKQQSGTSVAQILTTVKNNVASAWDPFNDDVATHIRQNITKPTYTGAEYNNYVKGDEKTRLEDDSKTYNYEKTLYNMQRKEYTLRLEQITLDTTKTIKTYGGSGNTTLLPTARDAPYKILLFPFGESLYLNNVVSPNALNQSERNVLNIVTNLANRYGGASPRIYDIQKIPYSTINLNKYVSSVLDKIYFNADGTGTDEKTHEMHLIKDGDQTPKLLMFEAWENTRTFETTVFNLASNDNSLKVNLSTTKCYIASSSYKSIIEYEYYKNNKNNAFRVTVDLKPITPFFNIDPVGSLDGLLPNNFDDGRGLNIAEDFSITQVNDAFSEYKRNNFNYLNSFNSAQEYERSRLGQEQANAKAQLHLKEKQAWENYGLSTATSIVKSTATGAAAGSVMGPIGAAVGAGLGAAKSIVDTGFNAASTGLEQKQARETLSLLQGQNRDILSLQQAQAKEQFNFNVENIQFLPAKLDKVSGLTSFTNNTARLIFYDTTDEERERVTQFYERNAYAINTYGFLRNYIDFDKQRTYVKGTIYQFSGSINNTILQDINTRLSIGLYFEKVGD